MVTGKDKNTELTALMQKSQAGDTQAYNQFLEEISRLLSRFLAKRMTEADIEDVLQEILISIHKARHTYDGKRPVLPWVMAIARFRFTDYLRQHYASMLHATVDLADIENMLVDVTFQEDSHESINDMLDVLPDKQKKILTLMHVEGYTAKEVGTQFGMSESAIKVAAHRAYKVIRKKWRNS